MIGTPIVVILNLLNPDPSSQLAPWELILFGVGMEAASILFLIIGRWWFAAMRIFNDERPDS
jgi:hypothetical protein